MGALDNPVASAAAAVATRIVLLGLEAGAYLQWRPEMSTPANSLLQVREGVRLLQLDVSPYSGTNVHVPPLVLSLLGPFVASPALCGIPNILADCLAALLVSRLARRLFNHISQPEDQGHAAQWLAPGHLALLYLWNPLAILSCVSGTHSTLENLCVLLAVTAAAEGNAPLAAFGVAGGAYLGMHPLLLLLPLAMMLAQGPEDVATFLTPCSIGASSGSRAVHSMQAQASADACHSHSNGLTSPQRSPPGSPPPTSPRLRQRHGAHTGEPKPALQPCAAHMPTAAHKQQPHGRGSNHAGVSALLSSPWRRWQRGAELVMFTALWALALGTLSDLSLRAHPSAQCLTWWRKAAEAHTSEGDLPPGAARECWAGATYGFLLRVADYTPNIGLFWYFFTEMFDAFVPFFRFVFHSHALVLAVPLALRFGTRPLFITWAQLLINCLFKPYPSAADLVPWMVLLPMLQQQLRQLRLGLLLANSFALLVVLGPAMWHQWIMVDAANSNFFYSITLLLGAWHVLLLVQMLLLTVRVERLAAGKPCVGMVASPPQALAPSSPTQAVTAPVG